MGVLLELVMGNKINNKKLLTTQSSGPFPQLTWRQRRLISDGMGEKMKKLKILLLALLGLCIFAVSTIVANNAIPLIVLIERDPWLMVIGSDSPSFVLYDDGTLIFLKTLESGKKEYLYVSLDNGSLQKIVKELAPPSDFLKLKDDYSLSDWTDQPTQEFIINLINFKKKVTVYGNLRNDEETRKKAPEPILELFDKIIGYHNKNAQKWLPSKIEVMVWPYEYAPDESIIWPSDWPDLNDKATKKIGDSYSLFLDSSKFNNLLEFLKTRKEKGAVEINNKKWAVSYRFPFPAEEKWMNP